MSKIGIAGLQLEAVNGDNLDAIDPEVLQEVGDVIAQVVYAE